MKGPIVSIDVSKGESHIQGFKSLNDRYSNVRKIKHDREGFNELLSLIQKNGKRTPRKGLCCI